MAWQADAGRALHRAGLECFPPYPGLNWANTRLVTNGDARDCWGGIRDFWGGIRDFWGGIRDCWGGRPMLDVPFIARYRQEYWKPVMSQDDLWRVFDLDGPSETPHPEPQLMNSHLLNP